MKMNRAGLYACLVAGLSLVGCDSQKEQPEQQEPQAAEVAAVKNHVSENDLYLKKMDTEITIDDPDSLIEDVNEKVGDNTANAEKARQNAVTDH